MTAPRFLFVHGAWHGAWCFDLLLLELQRRAVACAAVELPAMGDDNTEASAATFETGVERVVGMISGRRCILVCHSFGAFYATEAARRATGKVRGLVYLASYVPLPGDTFAALHELAPPLPEMQAAMGKDEAAQAWTLDPAKAQAQLYHDVADGIGLAAASRLKPQPMEPFLNAAVGEDEARHLAPIERRAIVAEDDRVLGSDACVQMAERAGVSVESIPTGHCPFLSMPKLLADMLLGVQ